MRCLKSISTAFLFPVLLVLGAGIMAAACAQVTVAAPAPSMPAWVNTAFAGVGGVLAVLSALGIKNTSFLAIAKKEIQDSHDAINAVTLFVQHNRAIIAKAAPDEIGDFNAVVDSVSSILIDSGSASLITKGKTLQALKIKVDADVYKVTGATAPAQAPAS